MACVRLKWWLIDVVIYKRLSLASSEPWIWFNWIVFFFFCVQLSCKGIALGLWRVTNKDLGLGLRTIGGVSFEWLRNGQWMKLGLWFCLKITVIHTGDLINEIWISFSYFARYLFEERVGYISLFRTIIHTILIAPPRCHRDTHARSSSWITFIFTAHIMFIGFI